MLNSDQTTGLGVGDKYSGQTVRAVIPFSDGRYLIKTEGKKSSGDFRVKLVTRLRPTPRSITPKHAHFAIDLYGKLNANKQGGMAVFRALMELWQSNDVSGVLAKYQKAVSGLPGYSLEYVLNALNWILEQEDVNFQSRPDEKQRELDRILANLNVTVPRGRLGSELAISLLCSITRGDHPVDAFIRANLDVLPVKRARGAV